VNVIGSHRARLMGRERRGRKETLQLSKSNVSYFEILHFRSKETGTSKSVDTSTDRRTRKRERQREGGEINEREDERCGGRENVRCFERKADVVNADDGARGAGFTGEETRSKRTCRCSWNLMGSSCVIFAEMSEGSVVARFSVTVPAVMQI